ncbi:hypothetical protein PVK06_040008 [Gossypium arboreum]|uniref:RNase H type-1 domain-containing protein n=1 Tax=Gossypium arboreum TaxID=29729 RepID=A0ABR0N4D0_GOSAR|nr:hypothetical protein PVK06_040008 [Gossypium arboreum]
MNLFIFQNISWSAIEVVRVFISWARQFKLHIGRGFIHYFGNCSPFEAEEQGILYGLLLLLDKGYERAIVLIDNLEVIQALSDLGLQNPCITVLRRTHRMMRADGQWKIIHLLREHNLATNQLAKLSLMWKSSEVFEETSKEILELLQKDKESGAFMQLV